MNSLIPQCEPWCMYTLPLSHMLKMEVNNIASVNRGVLIHSHMLKVEVNNIAC